MFLIIDEFDDFYKTYSVEDYLQGAKEGRLYIIDINNPENPLYYTGEQWIEIEDFS